MRGARGYRRRPAAQLPQAVARDAPRHVDGARPAAAAGGVEGARPGGAGAHEGEARRIPSATARKRYRVPNLVAETPLKGWSWPDRQGESMNSAPRCGGTPMRSRAGPPRPAVAVSPRAPLSMHRPRTGDGRAMACTTRGRRARDADDHAHRHGAVDHPDPYRNNSLRVQRQGSRPRQSGPRSTSRRARAAPSRSAPRSESRRQAVRSRRIRTSSTRDPQAGSPAVQHRLAGVAEPEVLHRASSGKKKITLMASANSTRQRASNALRFEIAVSRNRRACCQLGAGCRKQLARPSV